MRLVCRHEYAPLTTVLLFGVRQAALEQCSKCEKLRGKYSDRPAEEE